MIDKISESDLLMMEFLSNPVTAAEILFSNIESNLGEFSEKKYSDVRPYQYFFLSFDINFLDDPELTDSQNLKMREVLALAIVLGGRLTGKSCIAIDVDTALAIFHKIFVNGTIDSYDFKHVKERFEKILPIYETHPLFRPLTKTVNRGEYKVVANGCTLYGINDNILGKKVGDAWMGLHVERMWHEEASFLTKEVTGKYFMSQSEKGCIHRYTGMTTFSKASPMGEMFDALENQEKIVNLPSYVNPTWNPEKDKKAQEEFGGKASPSYKVQIEGRVIENGETVYNMTEVRKTYIKGIPIKAFEVNKNNFHRYQDELILDRPSGTEQAGVYLDLGEGGAPTEIIVLFKIGNLWNYEYNITTYKLSPEEEQEVLEFILKSVKFNICGIDHTSGGGKYLFSHLNKKYPGHIFAVDFNAKIEIDLERDPNTGDIVRDGNGEVEVKTERTDAWSIQRLKHIFYTPTIRMLTDAKLDKQIEGVYVKRGKTQQLFGYKTANHIFQAFMVFAIVEWQTEFKKIREAIVKPIQKPAPPESFTF